MYASKMSCLATEGVRQLGLAATVDDAFLRRYAGVANAVQHAHGTLYDVVVLAGIAESA